MELLVVAAVVVLVVAVLLALVLRRTERRTLAVTGEVRQVDVRLGAGAVVLAAAPDGQLRVERTMRWVGRRPHTSEEVGEGTLRIRQLPRAMSMGAVSYRLAIPPTARLVRARTGGGQISVVGVDAEVDLETGAGSIRVADLRGTLRVVTHAGSVTGQRLRCPQVHAESGAGSQAFAFVAAPDLVDVHTSAGTLEVTLPDIRPDAYQVEASSQAGRVQVEVPHQAGAARRVAARSEVGGVRIRLG